MNMAIAQDALVRVALAVAGFVAACVADNKFDGKLAATSNCSGAARVRSLVGWHAEQHCQ